LIAWYPEPREAGSAGRLPVSTNSSGTEERKVVVIMISQRAPPLPTQVAGGRLRIAPRVAKAAQAVGRSRMAKFRHGQHRRGRRLCPQPAKQRFGITQPVTIFRRAPAGGIEH